MKSRRRFHGAESAFAKNRMCCWPVGAGVHGFPETETRAKKSAFHFNNFATPEQRCMGFS
jgi:hypothetical protein